MTPKEALAYHLTSVFPILNGPNFGFFFTWKFSIFMLCGYLAWRNPIKYFWAGLMMFGLLPPFILADTSDIISKLTHMYLIWMSAEVTFRSLSYEPESRMMGWWLFPILGLLIL